MKSAKKQASQKIRHSNSSRRSIRYGSFETSHLRIKRHARNIDIGRIQTVQWLKAVLVQHTDERVKRRPQIAIIYNSQRKRGRNRKMDRSQADDLFGKEANENGFIRERGK